MINKPLKRSTLIILALCLRGGGIIAYAAFLKFAASDPENSDMTPEPFIAVELDATHLTGTISPGDTKSVSVVVTNPGTTDGMAYVRFSYPTINTSTGSAGSAYSWTINDGWSVVEEGSGYTVYGYESAIGTNGSTGSLMDSITMKNLSVVEYKALGDEVNVQFIGYVADCNEFGYDAQVAWERAN